MESTISVIDASLDLESSEQPDHVKRPQWLIALYVTMCALV